MAAPPPPATPARLVMAISHEPPTLDLHRTSNLSTSEVLRHVCEPLVYQGLDRVDKPLLAESWQMAPDGMSATFTLRDGITFHDGSPLNAAAVRFTFERLQQPESQESPLYDSFQGVDIETPDERTVFRFPEPRYDFPTTLRSGYAAILSPTAIEADEVAFGRQPSCTGPFQVKAWQPAQSVLLVRNPAYRWAPDYALNRGPVQLDELEINFIDEGATRFLALLNGELDLLSLDSAEQVAEIEQDPRFTLYDSWLGGITFLGFNYQRPPTNELAVRQALAHAINKDEIVATILPNLTTPAFAPLAPTTFGFDPSLQSAEYPYDPERARRLLAETGFHDQDGDGRVERNGQPLHLTLLTTVDEVYAQLFVLLQSQLQAVGVTTELRAVPTAEIAEITPQGDFDLLLYHYNWPHPSALALFLGSERVGASNRVAYSNPNVDELLARADQFPSDSPEKLALLIQAQEQILADAPWQPLLIRKIRMAVNNRVQGVRLHPGGDILLYDATVDASPP